MKQTLIWTAVAAVGAIALYLVKRKTSMKQVLSPEQTPEPQDKVLTKPRTNRPGLYGSKYQ